jgi:hypothetical protein
VIDESLLSTGAIWARIRVLVTPIDPRRAPSEAEVGAVVCSVPDLGDDVAAWAVELHTETGGPSEMGAHRPMREPGPAEVPSESFFQDIAFRSRAALTHVKTRCATRKGRSFAKAVRLPAPVALMPGDRARVQVDVYRDPRTQRLSQPSLRVFEEPARGGLDGTPRLVYEGRDEDNVWGGPSMGRKGLGAVEDSMRQARTLIDRLLSLNPSADDRQSVDRLLVECQAIYEGENVVDIPIITHVASQICFNKLIERVNDKIAKYTRPPVVVPPAAGSGWPWWAYGLAGLGGLILVGGAVALLAPKAAPAPAAAR